MQRDAHKVARMHEGRNYPTPIVQDFHDPKDPLDHFENMGRPVALPEYRFAGSEALELLA